MEETESVFYVLLAGRQVPRVGADAPEGYSGAPQPKTPEVFCRPDATGMPVSLTSETLMFSVRLTEATCLAIARAAKTAGKSQRQFLAGLAAAAGVAVHPADLMDRPKPRRRA